MKLSEQFAVDEWLSDYPVDATYEWIIQTLRDDKCTWVTEDITVWEVVENHPLDQVADFIESTQSHFERALGYALMVEAV